METKYNIAVHFTDTDEGWHQQEMFAWWVMDEIFSSGAECVKVSDHIERVENLDILSANIVKKWIEENLPNHHVEIHKVETLITPLEELPV